MKEKKETTPKEVFEKLKKKKIKNAKGVLRSTRRSKNTRTDNNSGYIGITPPMEEEL